MIQSMESVIGPTPPRKTVHKQLRRLLKDAWKDYRKSFTRCRREFSEASVHQLRIESRRLLALLNLVQPLVGEVRVERPRHLIKKLLRRFARLRDTQVQLLHLGEKLLAFPEAKPFRNALRERERRVIRRVGARMHGTRLGPIRASVSALRKEVRRVLADQPHERQHWNALLRAVHQAFGRTTKFRDHCHANDVATIHRLRIAFKEFRYMVELLQPLLPGVSKRALETLRSFQSRMGEIQDAEVLLAALDKFGRKKPEAAAAVQSFRRDVERLRGELAREFLADAGRIHEFWPPPPAGS